MSHYECMTHPKIRIIKRKHSRTRIIDANVTFRRRYIEGVDHTESHRDNLRQMLSKLRKDPMDDDLATCDGDYFPCEFCGDPYPVEYIMRHQVSICHYYH